MSTQKTMLGARVPPPALARLKIVARALGMSEADTLAHMIETYEGPPALQKAIKALQDADRLVSEARVQSIRSKP